jgi:hypothetical protein
VDRHPQYRHCPAVTRAIASGIIIIEVQNDHITSLSDGRTFTASNFRTKASRVLTQRMVVRTIDMIHAISISDARMPGP